MKGHRPLLTLKCYCVCVKSS